jgi:hypothetical protein
VTQQGRHDAASEAPVKSKIPVLPPETVASKKSQLSASADAARDFFLLVNHSASEVANATAFLRDSH